MIQHIATTRFEPSRGGKRTHSRFIVAIACGMACVVSIGCRSGSENDLVARELRMQEDQLYAMEDYLSQYQGLLRQARAENRQLKCQLSEQSGELPEPTPRANGTSSPAESSSSLPAAVPPTQPETNEAPTTPPPTNIEIPDVPSLDETTSTDGQSDEIAISPEIVADETYEDPQVLQASAEESPQDDEPALIDSQPSTASIAIDVNADETKGADEPTPAGPLTHVWLHGEVVANDAGGGPRLIVDVAPLTQAGRAATFAGDLSLMILAPTEGNRARSLARWDFSPSDLQTIAANQADEESLRFYLELPVDAPIDLALQLWVRMLPDSGEKILAHADLDIAGLGHFSSVLDKRPTNGPPKKIAMTAHGKETSIEGVARNQAKRRPIVPVDVNDGSWTVALPGKPKNLAQQSEQPSGDWRMTTEPIPVAVAQSSSTPAPSRYASAPHVVEQAAYLAEKSTTIERKFALPTWSPDRAGSSAGVTVADDEPRAAALPSWSPER